MGTTLGLPSSSTEIQISEEDEDLQDLHSLCQSKCWTSIERHATQFDSIHHTTLTAGNAPLHTAISNHAPLSVVQALVTANPPSVAFQNNRGNTPLHFAAWKNKGPDSVAVVRFLLEYHPQSAKCANHAGNLPLHYATNFKAPIAMVQAIYRAHPEAVTQLNRHQKKERQRTPLDHAIHRFGEKHEIVAVLRGEINGP